MNKNGLTTRAADPRVVTQVTAVTGETLGTVFDIGAYETFDETYALEALKVQFGKNMALTSGGCTCITKDRSVEGKGLLVGRNMDLSISKDYPVYKFQLNYGKYKAIGMAFVAGSGPTTEEILAEGLTSESAEKFLSLLPACATDYLNEAGLYIETDMRNLDYGTDPLNDYQKTKYGCDGTKPGKGLPDVFLASVPFYVSTRCSTVDEVLDTVRNDINIYSKITTVDGLKETNGVSKDWNYAFCVADARGNYGLIEIADNHITYTPGIGQANFYQNEEDAAIETYPTGGWGKRASTDYKSCAEENVSGAYLDGKKCRYAVVSEDLANVHTVADMQKNMRKVFYSQTYADQASGINAAINTYESPAMNPRYEMVQVLPLVKNGDGADDYELDFENGSVYLCTFDVLTNFSTEKFRELFRQYCNHHYTGKTLDQLMADNEDYWYTDYSIVTDIDNLTWNVTFYEGDEFFRFTIE